VTRQFLDSFVISIAASVGGFLLAALLPRGPRPVARSRWETAWFTPVYLWGRDVLDMIASNAWMHPAAFAPTAQTYVAAGLHALSIGGGILVVALLTEALAARRVLAARPRLGTIPLPVFAGIVGATAVWVSFLAMFLPF
jgi:hypothetical protein